MRGLRIAVQRVNSSDSQIGCFYRTGVEPNGAQEDGHSDIYTTYHTMPVPRRRNRRSGGISFAISDIPKVAMRLFDINYVFAKTRVALFYGFAPAIFYIGMTTEPRPQSWFEAFNILE